MTKKIPRGAEDLICPLHRSPMSVVCHVCPWWTQIRGLNPNTGQEIDDWNCAIGMLPMLTVNVANEARQGAAATESFRNETVKMGALSLNLAAFPDRRPPFLDNQNTTKLLGPSALEDVG